jgi:hypothetical protein
METEQGLTDNQDAIQVGLWMPLITKKKLEDLAKADDRNMSSYARRLIDLEHERVFGPTPAESAPAVS